MNARQPPVAILAALALAACAPSAPEAHQVEAAAAEPAPTATETVLACGPVGELFDDLARRKDAGATEDDALDVLRSGQAFTESYVVDALYRAKPETPRAITRADVLATCTNVHKTGATY